MTAPQEHGGSWVARTFTRARNWGGVLARIPLGDKSFDLPFVLKRTQVWALVLGAIAATLAYNAGAAFGIAAWTTWPVVVVTVIMTAWLGLSNVPDRGAAVTLEGFARAATTTLRMSAGIASSRTRPEKDRESFAMVMRLHPAPQPAPEKGN